MRKRAKQKAEDRREEYRHDIIVPEKSDGWNLVDDGLQDSIEEYMKIDFKVLQCERFKGASNNKFKNKGECTDPDG